ncbi:MAG: hypothetical protein GKS06_05475 [Acidobacteria bacterium]|nr:hypothetical protein [Acidobacteriota bacterium]
MNRRLNPRALTRSRRTWTAMAAAVAFLGVLMWPEAAEAQCAMCRRALADSEAGPLISALRSGIVFLLLVPIATFGAIAWFAVRGRDRALQTDES